MARQTRLLCELSAASLSWCLPAPRERRSGAIFVHDKRLSASRGTDTGTGDGGTPQEAPGDEHGW